MSNATITTTHRQMSTPRRHGSTTGGDGDVDGANDPTLDASLIATPDDGEIEGEQDSTELDIGQFIQPVRNLGADSDEADLELDTGSWLSEPAEAPADDDLDGPLAEQAFPAVFPDSTLCDREADDDSDSIDEELQSNEFPALDLVSETEDDILADSGEATPADVNDLQLVWSTQPWCELGLPTAFVPRASLHAQHNCVVASGDATDALSLDDFSVVDSFAAPDKSRCAAFLDDEARQLLVVTVTGQVRVWDRASGQPNSAETRRFRQIDRAMNAWRNPSTGTVWLRLATGELCCVRNDCTEVERIPIIGRCAAIGGTDSAIVCLLSQSCRLSLMSVDESGSKTLLLPPDVSDLAQADGVFLVALDNIIAVGARGHGLWLSPDNGTTFRKVPGCRNVTTCIVGQYSGKLFAWAALFFELEDRSELVGIDCRALRIHKLAEYRVVSDSSGPEDDPPERARIDALLWDSARRRILAAGCFGLTCFVPPHDPHIIS
jgi:hypothetical protein